MNKFFQRAIIFLMFWVHWKKIFFVGALLTLALAVLQIYVLPYPLISWPITTIVKVPLDKSLNNNLQLRESLPLATLEHSQGVIISSPVVLLNSTKSDQFVPLIVERSDASERISKENKVDVLPPPSLRPPPLSESIKSYKLKKFILSLTPFEGLLYAKKELQHLQAVTDDPDLYTPLFRNITLFKRSYELMEMILKVYIYPDGARPIFHYPYLRGIYASEGWFMRFMEGNRQFVTRDPEKAHLFYLPYSSRQLEMAKYVPDSHDLKPLSIFLRDYVRAISSKYPFWNRTRGSDHFLVACHDWGPYTLSEHTELRQNTIKALCNADLSEGIFVASKDVSLPETTIRNPKKPLRNLGGKRASQREILAFFAGHMHGRVRPLLLQHWKNRDPDMRIYGVLPVGVSRKMSYVEHMKSSRFCICPMGYEVNSPRIVEAIYYECVPVIIADNFVPPFDDVLDWSAFSVIVAERDVARLKEILAAVPLRRYVAMQINVKMLQKHFVWNPKPLRYDLFHMILHSVWSSRLNHVQTPQV